MNYGELKSESSYPMGVTNLSSQQPLFEALSVTFNNCHNQAHELLYQIEDRLHLLLNRRVPQEPSSAKPQEPVSDVFSKLTAETQSAKSITDRLERIAKHLSEIV